MWSRTLARRLAVMMAGLGLSCFGCTEPSSVPAGGDLPPAATERASQTASEAVPAPAVSLEPIDGEGLAKAVEQRRGKVVLVDFWATWCIPCVELFPHTVELHRKFSEQGLSVISVAMDEPESEQEVLQVLTRQNATFPNFISRFGLGSQAVEAFRITGGALPHLKLYDRSGKPHREFVAGQFTPEQIDEAVNELLEQP